MLERDVKIIEAAFGLFAHYGVGKTSMAEVAIAAGVARQTVYNAFESKEDLIFMAFLHYAGEARAAVERECATVLGLSPRLDILYRHLVDKPYEAMQTLPHLEEVLEAEERLSADRRAEIKALYRTTIRTVLAPFEAEMAANGVSAASLAELLKGTFTQMKREAVDAAHLKEMFETVKAMIAATAGQKPDVKAG
ncbi:MAG: helix-turn-helix domain-containing protein [Pseudomonadota bacterium]